MQVGSPPRKRGTVNWWMREPRSQPDIENWYNKTGRRVLKRLGGLGALVQVRTLRERDLYAVLSEKESEIVGRENERAYILTSSGEVVFQKDGTTNRIDFTREELQKMKGNISTHNHNNGGSLSRDDFELAATNGLAEIRAVGGGFEHSMKPLEKWPALDDKLANLVDKTDRAVRTEFWRKIALGQMTNEQAEREHYHQVWSRLASKLGVNYRRVPR